MYNVWNDKSWEKEKAIASRVVRGVGCVGQSRVALAFLPLGELLPRVE